MGFFMLFDAMFVFLLMVVLGVGMALERGVDRKGRRYLRPWLGIVLGIATSLAGLALFVGGAILLTRQR